MNELNKNDKQKENCVDIILPNYNKANFLEECISSVCDQTFKNWKLFIIDDNSTDDSRKIIEKYSKENTFKIFLKKNKGVSFCRNLAIRISNSKYIAFLDSDDYWEHDKLEGQILFMEKNKLSFTYSDYTPFTYKNESKKFKKKIFAPDSFNYEQFTKNTSIGMSSMIINRSVLGTIKFPKVKICEDYSFKCSILKKKMKIYDFRGKSLRNIIYDSPEIRRFSNLYTNDLEKYITNRPKFFVRVF